MASLVTCKLCKKEHSDDVKRCPSCGAKYSKPLSKRPFALVILGFFSLVVLTMVLGSLGGRGSPAQSETANASKVTPPPSTETLKTKFAADRSSLMSEMMASLKSNDFYTVLGKANDYENVADLEFIDLLKKVKAGDKKTSAQLQEKLAASESKEAKKKGVTVGMTKAQARASSWGKPQSVNTTTSAYGNREQWVYGSRSYLYFENGILTTIQN